MRTFYSHSKIRFFLLPSLRYSQRLCKWQKIHHQLSSCSTSTAYIILYRFYQFRLLSATNGEFYCRVVGHCHEAKKRAETVNPTVFFDYHHFDQIKDALRANIHHRPSSSKACSTSSTGWYHSEGIRTVLVAVCGSVLSWIKFHYSVASQSSHY